MVSITSTTKMHEGVLSQVKDCILVTHKVVLCIHRTVQVTLIEITVEWKTNALMNIRLL